MKDATEIVVILDRSGSMYSIKDDAIGGFNNFLKEQKKEKGEANLTLIQFSTYVDTQVLGKPLDEVPELTEDTYKPGGLTALNDALAHGIIETGRRLEKLSEDNRPDKVIVALINDGCENASKEYSKQSVANMVKHQEEKYNWQFLYLGSNLLAFEEAKKDPSLFKLVAGFPHKVKMVRLVDIVGLVKEADGGTHVKSCKEVGHIKFAEFKNKGKNNRRIYFELED